MNTKIINTKNYMDINDLIDYYKWRLFKIKLDTEVLKKKSQKQKKYSKEYLSIKKLEVDMWREQNILESLLKKIN